ncbi:hypothetical protein HJO_08167 [Hyphomonas johnsonii MHS-2]|uniref:Uncharacterized protein n=1 Tax=Hyphomonas johnsonii MHS-2 TaxID=1280950 RepID=A0A059FQG8_9PROT|nr:hypothetical protein HJO_08167 [Hyphomonas johnsonii MHS-2]
MSGFQSLSVLVSQRRFASAVPGRMRGHKEAPATAPGAPAPMCKGLPEFREALMAFAGLDGPSRP